MADESDYSPYRERQQLFCQLFVPCHTVWYDVDRPERGYSLGRVLCEVTPEPGTNYPLLFPRVFGYAHLHGDVGEYSVRICLVEIGLDEEGEEHTWSLGEYGEFGTFGPWAIELTAEDFVNQYGFPLRDLVTPAAGLYEFQFWHDADDGEHELLSRIRVWAKERT